jgi:F0F1-type ATP synthase membrane subunit a
MCPDAPHFIILLCIMPDNFTHQGESVLAHRCVLINLPAHAAMHQGESAATQWVNVLQNVLSFIKDHVKSVLHIRSAQAYIPMVGTRPLECY